MNKKNEQWFEIDGFNISFMRINCSGDLLHFPVEDVILRKTDCGYSFEVYYSGTVTMLVSCCGEHLLVDDNIKEVNLDLTTEYYHRITDTYVETAEYMTPISRPIIHCVKDRVFSFSTPSECIIQCFLYDYQPAFSIETTNQECSKFLIDIASNYLLNLQRYKTNRGAIYLEDHIDVKQMAEILYYAYDIIPKSIIPIELMNTAKRVQKILKDEGVFSVIFGSLANILNGLDVQVRDIDLMFTSKDMRKARDVLVNHGEIIEDTDFRSRIKIDDCKVEVSYDRFKLLSPLRHICTENGLTYFNVHGLLLICLMSFYRLHRETHVFDYTTKAERQSYRAYRLLDPEPDTTILPGIQEDKFRSIFLELLDKLHHAEMAYYDVRINRPFSLQCYKDENVMLLPILNRGSSQNARIIVPKNPIKATWRDISGHVEEIKCESHEDFTILFVSDLWLPGVLSVEYEEL